jgi:hypothetical protein
MNYIPLYIYGAIWLFLLGVSAHMHGEPKKGKHDFRIDILSVVIHWGFILWFVLINK